MKSRDIAPLEAAIGYRFNRPELIEQALTHSSQARELESMQIADRKPVPDNEQLEFLGDAVLGFVTTQELFQRFPSFHEGELSKLRAHLVSEKHLIRVAQLLNIGHYLRLGRGEEKSGGRHKPALLVDALEAILAAVYLDGGFEAANIARTRMDSGFGQKQFGLYVFDVRYLQHNPDRRCCQRVSSGQARSR